MPSLLKIDFKFGGLTGIPGELPDFCLSSSFGLAVIGTNSRLVGGRIGPFREGLARIRGASGCLGVSQETCLTNGDTVCVLKREVLGELICFCNFFTGTAGRVEGSGSFSSGIESMSSDFRDSTGDRTGDRERGTGVVFLFAAKEIG